MQCLQKLRRKSAGASRRGCRLGRGIFRSPPMVAAAERSLAPETETEDRLGLTHSASAGSLQEMTAIATSGTREGASRFRELTLKPQAREADSRGAGN